MAQLQEVFLFQPTQISGCSLWLDAADSSTISLSGTSVTAWRDKSSLSNNYVQTNPSYYPTYVLDTVYNARGIRFINGTGTHLTPQSSSIYSINAAFWTTFVVVRYSDSSISSGTVQSISRTVSSGNNWIRYHQGAMSFYIVTSDVQFGRAFSAVSGMYSAVITNSQTVYQNGTLAGSGSRGSTPVVSDAFNIGGNGASEGMSGFIFEYIIYNGVGLSTSQRQQIEGYLAWKWGLQGSLPGDHPFKTYRPIAQSPVPTNIPPMPIITQNTPVFNPASISGCQLWLDGADPTSFSLNGSVVIQWRDKSGSNLNFSTTSGSPTFSTGVNIPDGAIMSSSSNYSLTTNTYVYIVSRLASGSINMMLGFTNISPTENTGDYSIRYASNLLNGLPNKTGNVNDFANNNYYVNGFYIPSFSTTVYSSIHIISGQSQFNGSTGVTLSSAFLSRYFTGGIYELLFYSSPPTTAQRQQVEGYLAWKWGLTSSLPSNHPYRLTPFFPIASPQMTTTGSASTWQPTQISGMSLWLDGADPNNNGTLPANGSSLTTWTDKSGNGKNFTANGAAGTYNTTRKALVLSNNRYDSSFSANVTNETLFTVFLPTLNQSMYILQSTVGGGRGVGTYGSASMYGIVIEDIAWGATTSGLNGTNTVNIGVSVVANKTNTQVSVNGGSLTNVSTFTAYSAGNTILGKDKLSQYSWYGDVYEIISFNAVLTTQQRQQVEGYLAWKWGIQSSLPANHPYKRWPPPS